MKIRLNPEENIIEQFLGSKVEARNLKEWLIKRALTVGTWYLTNHRLIFEGKKPNPFFTLVWKDLPSEVFLLKDINGLAIVPWMKMEQAMKVTFTNGDSVLIRLQWQTREKLEFFKCKIEETKAKLMLLQPPR